MSSSGRFIKRNGLLNDPWAKVRAEEAGRYEIDRSTEELRQLGLKSDESKTDQQTKISVEGVEKLREGGRPHPGAQGRCRETRRGAAVDQEGRRRR